MVTNVFTPSGYPNIAVVAGNDVYSDEDSYRGDLKNVLHLLDRGPVYRGSHDFWITYPLPKFEGNRNFGESYVEHGILPRPLRGIIQMGAIPEVSGGTSDDAEQLSNEVGVLLEEVGHYWSVRPSLEFRSGNRTLGLEQNPVARLNERMPFEGLPLIGRMSGHWSAYFDADNSAFDGQNFERATVDRVSRWQEKRIEKKVRSASGAYPAYPLRRFYNDLDLHAMGVLRRGELYPNDGGKLRWIEPVATSPLDYLVGVFVAFSAHDYLYFGFYKDHETLVVKRTGESAKTFKVPGYHRFGSERPRLALRITRRGREYQCEARLDGPDEGVRDLFTPGAPATSLPSGGAHVAGSLRFQTFDTCRISERPLAVGLIVARYEDSFLAEGDFSKFAVRRPGQIREYPLTAIPSRTAELDLRNLPARDPVLHVPVQGPTARSVNGQFLLTTPFASSGAGLDPSDDDLYDRPDHTARRDRAPKVVVKAPNGDFTVAASVRVGRTIYAPWYGGAAKGKTVWGHGRSLDARGVQLPGSLTERRQAPPGNTYRCAFIIVTDRKSRVTPSVAQNLDNVRKAFDAAFRLATRRKRSSRSRLGR